MGFEGDGLQGGTRRSTNRILKNIIGRNDTMHLNRDRTNQAFARHLEENIEELTEAALFRKMAGEMKKADPLAGPPSDHQKRTTFHINN
ncbi:MAG: hypothetical protein WAW37_10870 [Syntrophobacteraceae bacterium]